MAESQSFSTKMFANVNMLIPLGYFMLLQYRCKKTLTDYSVYIVGENARNVPLLNCTCLAFVYSAYNN
jgi:hypothetical protein